MAGASVSFPTIVVPFVAFAISVSDGGGVSAAAPPGKERDEGEVKALACWAVDGCVVSVSMFQIRR